MFFVRMSVVLDQDVLISRKFATPESDNERRTTEFTRSAGNFVMCDLPVPGCASGKQYAGLALYLTPGIVTEQGLPASLFPRVVTNDMARGWSESAEFPIVVAQLESHGRTFCLAAGFPPGELKDDLCFGFPMRAPKRDHDEGQR